VATDYAIVPFRVEGQTTTTAIATYGTLDIRKLLHSKFWNSCIYQLDYIHLGKKVASTTSAMYGRAMLCSSNASGVWTIIGTSGDWTAVESNATWNIGETAATSHGINMRGNGNTGVAETVNWLAHGTVTVIRG
jgi:hypothetical protein